VAWPPKSDKKNVTKTRKNHQPQCQLYLVVQALPGEATLARLGAALEAARIASVLFVPPNNERIGSGEQASASGAKFADTLKPLIALAQAGDAAALLLDDAGLVKSLKTDGVHLSAADPATDNGGNRIEDVRAALLSNYILGATAGPLRDDAMILGERGADYVGFALSPSLLDPSHAKQDLLERVSWWAQIFEIPSVVFDVATTDEAHELAEAGADFIAFNLPADASPASTAEYVRAMVKAIAITRAID